MRIFVNRAPHKRLIQVKTRAARGGMLAMKGVNS
jgi:hypothetical protein